MRRIFECKSESPDTCTRCKLRADGPDGGAALGAEQHQQIRRRPELGDAGGARKRRGLHQLPDDLADDGAGALPPRDPAVRLGVLVVGARRGPGHLRAEAGQGGELLDPGRPHQAPRANCRLLARGAARRLVRGGHPGAQLPHRLRTICKPLVLRADELIHVSITLLSPD